MNKFDYDIYDVNSYDYKIDDSKIAQSPSLNRDESKLLEMNRTTGQIIDHKYFKEIIDSLNPTDILVRNNTKVIPARLIGVKKETGAHVQLLLLNQIEGENDVWECLTGNARTVKVGTRIYFGDDDQLIAECIKVKDEGIRIIKFFYSGIFMEVLEKLGRMPLPPYIHEQLLDNSRYQTVYAKIDGSAAAPTAGFHFTNDLFKKLNDKGIQVLDITLHVGLGTFRPVKDNDIRSHIMHTEVYKMDKSVAEVLNNAKKENRKIIAIGTTTTRTLETIYKKYNRFEECSSSTNLFIYPGFEFKAIDGLITNFHLPKSTLLMLVSAFSTRENILNAYDYALNHDYRFFSFGDAMFIH